MISFVDQVNGIGNMKNKNSVILHKKSCQVHAGYLFACDESVGKTTASGKKGVRVL